jgi:hypothetical protein
MEGVGTCDNNTDTATVTENSDRDTLNRKEGFTRESGELKGKWGEL